jgi:hypothetical protein
LGVEGLFGIKEIIEKIEGKKFETERTEEKMLVGNVLTK